jgi:hypothetical protein
MVRAAVHPFFWNVTSPEPLKSLIPRQYNLELRGKATQPSLPHALRRLSLIITFLA